VTTDGEPMNPDPATSKVDCLFVLAMHRSGSSLLAGCLHLLGAELGENLMRPTEHNPDGHWENHDLVVVHDILLRDLGCQWDMIGGLPHGWLDSPAAERAREHIRGVLEKSFPPRGLWSIKDPRMCRLMPLWEPVLQGMGVRPGFVVILRHPWEVSHSLRRRDGFDLLKGHLLWMIHNREALEACRDKPHAVTTYDRLLADPVTTLARIADAVGVEFPQPLGRHYRRILDFVRPDLKHQHVGQPSDADERNRFRHFAWLYDQLCAREAGRPSHRLAPEKGGAAVDAPAGFPLHPLVRVAPDGPASVALRDASMEHEEGVFRDFLSLIGGFERSLRDHHLEKERKILSSTRTGTLLFAQIFFPAPDEPRYAEERSASFLLPQNEWQEIRAPVPDPGALRTVPLRLDPLNANGMVGISGVELVNPATGSVCWSARQSGEFDAFQVGNDAFRVPSAEGLRLMVFGHDPWVFLPVLPELPDGPLEVRIWMKAGSSQREMEGIWRRREQEEAGLRESLDEARKAREALQAEKAGLEERRVELMRELEGARVRAAEAEAEAVRVRELLEAEKAGLEERRVELMRELEGARLRAAEAEAEAAREAEALEGERARLAGMLRTHQEERTRREAREERLAAEYRELRVRLAGLEEENRELLEQRARQARRYPHPADPAPLGPWTENRQGSEPLPAAWRAGPSGGPGAAPSTRAVDRLAESLRGFCGRIEAREADLARHEDRLRAFARDPAAPSPGAGPRRHE